MSIFDGVLNNLPGFADRFWYWHGKSGTRYIHSIYSPHACPPLPGAVYITVKKLANGKRVAIDIGRFCQNWDYVEAVIDDKKAGFSDIDEIHVHLLASSDENACDVVADIEAGIGPRVVFGGFHESMPDAVNWQQSRLFDAQPAARELARV